MSKRRKPGDWVWLPPDTGYVKLSYRLKVEIQPDENPDVPDPCYLCKDHDCRRWNTVRSEPDPERENYRHSIRSVPECQMSDEMQDPEPKRRVSIKRLLLPEDTNHRGEIFGGAILAEIDLAGAIETRRHTKHDVATRYMNGVEFNRPVAVGGVVTFYTTLVKIGTTSITVRVEVEAEFSGESAPVAVVATEVVYVAIKRNEDGTISKVPVKG